MRILTIVSVLAFTVASNASAQQVVMADWFGAKPASAITVSPGSESGTYVIRAKVTDLRTSKVLGAPELKTLAGLPATFEMGVEGKVIIKFVVTVDTSGRTARYVTEVRRDGELESQQEAALTLPERG